MCLALVGTKPTDPWLPESRVPWREKDPLRRFLSVVLEDPVSCQRVGSSEGQEIVKEEKRRREEERVPYGE